MNPNLHPWVTDNMTFVSPVGMGVTLALGLALLLLPRRHAIYPVLALVCYMTMGQRVMIGGLNFTMIRILIVFGWARLVTRGELRRISFNAIDGCLVAWAVVGVIAHTMLADSSADMVYRLGVAYDSLGAYFLFRFLLCDRDDVTATIRALSILVVPLAIMMMMEHFSGRNLFAAFGGVPAISEVRDGRIRAQGPFGHEILAGTFGATILPFFLGLRLRPGKDKLFAYGGIASATAIVLAAGSSGPAIALICGVLAFSLWPIRQYMRVLRWALLGMLVLLQIVMKAPVWFLIGRFTVFNGSTGYHRAFLIDRAIANFPNWWLFGTKSTAHWGYELVDVTNFYIRQGIEGGVATLALFVAAIALCFGAIGRAWRATAGEPRWVRMQVWALGAALFAHAVSFISISYTDQNVISFALLLAMISHVSLLKPAEAPVPVKTEPILSWRDMAIQTQYKGRTL